MKNVLLALIALMIVASFGCSAGETSQSKVEEDAANVTLDKNAAPDPQSTQGVGVAPMKKGSANR